MSHRNVDTSIDNSAPDGYLRSEYSVEDGMGPFAIDHAVRQAILMTKGSLVRALHLI